MANYIHLNTRIEIVEVFTSRDEVLSYERRAGEYPSKENAEYPIPDECTKFYRSEYYLKGEWTHPVGQARDTRWASWFRGVEKEALPAHQDRKIIYYIHGGAYVFGTARLYRPFTGNLCEKLGLSIFTIEYRLAPEHPFPSGLRDVFAGYLWLAPRL
jgi:acetyl esterase/lipase